MTAADRIVFLKARIGEDEAAASMAAWDGHTWIPEPCHVARADTDVCVTTFASDAVHIARWDPPRVLAECAAKRWMVDAYVHAESRVHGGPTAAGSEWDLGVRQSAWDAVCLLTLLYAAHPDFQNEWKL